MIPGSDKNAKCFPEVIYKVYSYDFPQKYRYA